MNALVSGRNRVALWMENDQLSSIHLENLEQVVPRKQEDLRWLLGEKRDVWLLENVERPEIEGALVRACRRENIVQLVLCLLDEELTSKTRQQAARELEAELADHRALLDLENVLFSQPLPAEADLLGGAFLAVGQPLVDSFLDRLQGLQPQIERVAEAWDRLPENFFDDRERWNLVAVREGLFRVLVEWMESQDSVKLKAELDEFEALGLPRFSEIVGYLRALLLEGESSGAWLEFHEDPIPASFVAQPMAEYEIGGEAELEGSLKEEDESDH